MHHPERHVMARLTIASDCLHVTRLRSRKYGERSNMTIFQISRYCWPDAMESERKIGAPTAFKHDPTGVLYSVPLGHLDQNLTA